MFEVKKIWMFVVDYVCDYYVLVREEILNIVSYLFEMKEVLIV